MRIGVIAELLWGLIWLLGYLSDVLIAVALLLAYLINPLVILVQKKVPNRVAAKEGLWVNYYLSDGSAYVASMLEPKALA